jgi:hypothetical protein
VPGQGRHAGRPVAGSASPGRVSVAPRPHLGWWRHHLDLAHERWLLAQRFDDPAFRRPTPLPGDPIGPRRRPGGHRGRPGPWYDRHRSKMRWPAWPPTGASPAWVRSRWPARSVTGAGSPPPPSSWASAVWSQASTPVAPAPPGPHHQVWQQPPARPAGRVGLGRPLPGRGHRGAAPPPGWPAARVVARAGTAQLRLCGRFRRLAARNHTRQVAVVAVARALAGFLWAEMTAEHARPEAITPPVGLGVIVAAMTRRRPAAAGPIPAVLCHQATPGRT